MRQADRLSEWVLPLLRCPSCLGPLRYTAFDAAGNQGFLSHPTSDCGERYPVIDGIPRLLPHSHRGGLVRAHRHWFQDPRAAALAAQWVRTPDRDKLVTGFDDEWQRFGEVDTRDHNEIYRRYFDLVTPADFEAGTVLDCGSGAGRWAFETARRGPRVIAVDLGRSIELARRNTSPDRVACVQADITALPLASDSVDWAYSLGVVHHLAHPELALEHMARVVRPSGFVLLYVYYALDRRGPLFRAVFTAVDLTRRVVSRAPRAVARAFAACVAACVYWPLARSAAVLERVGARSLAASLPLNFYRDKSFRTMRNDSLDRFGTRIERRYTRAGLGALLVGAGLVDVRISESPPFWHGLARKRDPSGSDRAASNVATLGSLTPR